MTARELYAEIRATLAAAGMTAAVETNVLFEKAVGRRYTELPFDYIIPAQAENTAGTLAERRVNGEPLQYIAGSWPFLDFELEVGDGVLIPRPETENTAAKALEMLKELQKPYVIDLCSGTGCIAIAIKRALPKSEVTAVELFPDALEYLRANVAALAPGVKVAEADVRGYERQLDNASIDMIISNPPYVTPDEYKDNIDEIGREPMSAFIGGEDGLDFYRYIIQNYKSKLKPGGIMLFETGFTQTDAVESLFVQNGYSEAKTYEDAYGLPRVVAARV